MSKNLEFFHQLYPYLVFITNKNLVFITDKDLVFITDKDLVFITNKNLVFITNKNLVFIGNKERGLRIAPQPSLRIFSSACY